MTEAIQAEAEKLNQFFERITSCRVLVEGADVHQRPAHKIHVRIELGVPGKELVVNYQGELHGGELGSEASETGEQGYTVVHEAFKAMRRQLQDYATRLRAEVKLHVGK